MNPWRDLLDALLEPPIFILIVVVLYAVAYVFLS